MTEAADVYQTKKFLGFFTTLCLAAQLSRTPDETVAKLAKRYRKQLNATQLIACMTGISKSPTPAAATLIAYRTFRNELPFSMWFETGEL
ncbi:hypothetical protein HPC38_02535 [Pasteurellaceae bacterium HPA106]|uniref:hypothetical protein n=1 Tax=Spirabiliibacterium pneumoniae TaxID=221400 RepID=UPI001AAC9E27|nr:hypothetical protein [Spirabiliibacterium pneumoniae]MBE2895757.1 hypothetical protein [Spirabiliibacterium pneumoniae]